ncbi:MAG: 16S rRNA (cytidine(1402)-2'-O)-methyltransferase [Arachnia sp.]
MSSEGALVLAGTPIGSHRDASPALVAALEGADVIAAEDTRVVATLLRRIGATSAGRVVSYFDGNEAARAEQLVEWVAAGQRVVIVTDAGMPTVSDPGYRAVAACIERGLRVTAVPGPSAVLTALAVSGLAVDRFCFEGFLPRKRGERRARFADLVTEQRTSVFFEAPHRLADFLADAAEVLGEHRRAAVCRELTKPHEEIRRDDLAGLRDWAAGGVRGEITVVIAGAAPAQVRLAEAVALVQRHVADGQKLSLAAAQVAAATGHPRKALYDAVLAARKEAR